MLGDLREERPFFLEGRRLRVFAVADLNKCVHRSLEYNAGAQRQKSNTRISAANYSSRQQQG